MLRKTSCMHQRECTYPSCRMQEYSLRKDSPLVNTSGKRTRRDGFRPATLSPSINTGRHCDFQSSRTPVRLASGNMRFARFATNFVPVNDTSHELYQSHRLPFIHSYNGSEKLSELRRTHKVATPFLSVSHTQDRFGLIAPRTAARAVLNVRIF